MSRWLKSGCSPTRPSAQLYGARRADSGGHGWFNKANNSFDASKGVEFEIFAKNRIRGAILDQVRKLSHLPRSAIVNIRDHNEATVKLSSQLGREPTQSELAEFMGKDMDEFQRERTHAHRFETMSLEAQSEIDELPSRDINEPESDIAEQQLKAALAESIETLPERERMVVALYYVEEMNLKKLVLCWMSVNLE